MRTGGTLPSVKEGQPLTFINDDAPVGPGIWHSITACKAPCNLETGIAYPLADADIPFDSGQLGTQGAPTTGHIDWSTPTTCLRAPTPTSVGSTRSCGVRSW